MEINFDNKTDLVERFLRPISALTENAVLKLKNNTLSCLTNNEIGIILYAEYKTDIEGDINFNVPDIKRLEKLLSYNSIPTKLKLEFKSNCFSYKDKNIRFKYKFLDDNIIQEPKINLKNLEKFDFPIQFSTTNIHELARGASFVSESEKLYININEEGVYGEITDKTNSSVDSYSVLLSDEQYTTNMSFPIHYDIVRLLASSTKSSDNIFVKINTDQGFCVFELSFGDAQLTYIVTGLQS